jgi:hypothetical protein
MTQLAHRHRHHANDITSHQLMARTYGVNHGRRAARRLASVLRNAPDGIQLSEHGANGDQPRCLALGLNGSSPSAGIVHIGRGDPRTGSR